MRTQDLFISGALNTTIKKINQCSSYSHSFLLKSWNLITGLLRHWILSPVPSRFLPSVSMATSANHPWDQWNTLGCVLFISLTISPTVNTSAQPFICPWHRKRRQVNHSAGCLTAHEWNDFLNREVVTHLKEFTLSALHTPVHTQPASEYQPAHRLIFPEQNVFTLFLWPFQLN